MRKTPIMLFLSMALIVIMVLSTKIIAAPVGTCPPDPTVHLKLPDDQNCSKFYECDHGVPVAKYCPAGLYYDINYQLCNWPWDATTYPGCGED